MIKKVFTLYDSKAEVYLNPFFDVTQGSAIRSLQDSMKNQESILHQHKEDLSLYYIGDYDDSTSILSAAQPKQLIGSLKDLDPNLEKVNNK